MGSICGASTVYLCMLFSPHLINGCVGLCTHRSKSITCKGQKLMVKKSRHYTFMLCWHVSVHHAGHMSTPPPPLPSRLPWSRGHVLWRPWSLHDRPADQPRNGLFNSLHHAGPSITDPMVSDKVLSCHKGWQINLNPDWWAGMRLSGWFWLICHTEQCKALFETEKRGA